MRRRTVLSALAASTGVGASAGCLTTGSDPATTGDGGEQDPLEDTDGADEDGDGSENDEDSGSDGDGSTTGSGGGADVDFEASVESVEKCSTTCRTLTYALSNRGTDEASDVVVDMHVFTGGERIWNEEQAVGAIEAESRRSFISRDIDVGIMGGQKIKGNDGAVVIELTPSAGGVSETFEFERTLDV